MAFAIAAAPRTVHDATLSHVRAWILDGTLRPGTRLHQDRLARMLGVSRMPVREAIRQLAAEGLVQIVPHRGAFVSSLDASEIRELYLIRAALEALAAGLAVQRSEPVPLERLQGLVRAMWEAIAAADDEAAIELDRQFHDAIYEAAGAPHLWGLIQQERTRSDAFRRAHAHIPGRAPISTQEHAALLAAIARRDRAEVEHRTREHLLNAAEHLIAYLSR